MQFSRTVRSSVIGAMLMGIAGILNAAQVGPQGKLPPPDIGEIKKALPSQDLKKLILSRITAIEPKCVVKDNAIRVRGSGFGAAQGSQSVRVAGQVIKIRSWKDNLIVGTVPGLAPGQAVDVEVRGGQGQVLVRGKTTACAPKAQTKLGKVVPPSTEASGLPTGKRQHKPLIVTKPKETVSETPLTTPQEPTGASLLKDLKGRQAVPAPSVLAKKEALQQERIPAPTSIPTPRAMPKVVTPSTPVPGAANTNPRPGTANPLPPPGAPRTMVPPGAVPPPSAVAKRRDVQTVQELLNPITKPSAPAGVQPLPRPTGVTDVPRSGFGGNVQELKKRLAETDPKKMAPMQAQEGQIRSTTLAVVGSNILRINGNVGPTVAVAEGGAINVDWSSVDEFVEAVAPGENVTLYWLALGDDNAVISNACNRSDPGVAGLPERSEEPGDGRFLRSTTSSAFTGLATDQTYYVKLCIRTSDGRTNAWRHESQLITLNLGATGFVYLPDREGILTALDAVRDTAPDLVVRAIQVSQDPGGGAGQLLIRFADDRGREHFREYFDGQQATRRSAGQPAGTADIYPFGYEVYVDGVHKPEASGNSHLPPSGAKHVITSRYRLPGDGRPHEVLVRVTPRFVDHNGGNNARTEFLEGVPARMRITLNVGSRFAVLRDGDDGNDDPGELEEVQLRLGVLGVSNLVFEKLRTRDGRINVNGSGAGRSEINIRRGDVVNADFRNRVKTFTVQVGDRVEISMAGTEHDLPCVFNTGNIADCREIGLLSNVFPVP
ncbi:MAG: IPT/TIG domain-containing protein, partial [Gammaproteobacteria bacterium]|nr:IPT/TIG domain-containing protein [Gammaproteobacteria bacterium]